MKKIIFLYGMILFFSTILYASELYWEKDTATAFSRAKAEKRDVMVMMESAGCRWCHKMQHTTLSNERVIERLQKYILVKIQRSDKEEMQILPESYYPAPTIFFMTPRQEVIDSLIGYYEAKDFLAYLDEIEGIEQR